MVDYLEEGSMINGAYYAEKLRRLCQKIVKIRGKLTRGLLCLLGNAQAHSSQVAVGARLNAASRSFLVPHILQM